MDVMTGALYIDVDPYSFLSFIDTRMVTRTGVLRFESLFFSWNASNIRPAAAKLLGRSDIADMVHLEKKNLI